MTAAAVTEKRKQQRATRTRTKILVKAAHLFDTHGYAATTINDVCESGLLTKGAIYYHFTSKEEIAGALIGMWVDAATDISNDIDGDPLDALTTLASKLADTAAKNPELRAGLKLSTETQIDASYTGYESWTSLVTERICDAVDAGQLVNTPAARLAGNGICAALVGFLITPGSGFTFTDRFAETVNAILAGLRPLKEAA